MTTVTQKIISSLGDIRTEQERLAVREFPRTLGALIGEHLSLPGLVGFWPMSQILKSSGNASDASGNGKVLTYNGNPTYNLYNSIVPYLDCDGTGDFLNRADETDFDILGSETVFAAAQRGLSLGCWFNQDNVTGDQALMGKWTTAGNLRQYKLFSNAGVISLGISSNGTAEVIHTGSTVTAGGWHFAAGVWTPSTTGVVWVDGVKTSSASAVAAMNNLTSPFRIGDRGDGTTLLTGNITLCFLCANILPDARIQRLYNLGRVFFGV